MKTRQNRFHIFTGLKPVILIALLTLGIVSCVSGPGIRVRPGDPPSFSRMIQRLSRSRVVFIGEVHNHQGAHRMEERLLRELFQATGGKVVLSLEMFERDVQTVLDAYLKGQISESVFMEKSRPWKNYPAAYRGMVEYARERGIPVVAANVPRRYASMSVWKGLKALENLPPSERKSIARRIFTDFPDYRKRFYRTMEKMTGSMEAQGARKMKEKFYVGQCVKDSTMAESISRALDAYPGYRVVHVNGRFHSDYRQGTVAVLSRIRPGIEIRTVTLRSQDEENPEERRETIADYILVIP